MDHDAKSDFIALLAAEARSEDIDTGPDTVYRGPSQKSIRRRKAQEAEARSNRRWAAWVNGHGPKPVKSEPSIAEMSIDIGLFGPTTIRRRC